MGYLRIFLLILCVLKAAHAQPTPEVLVLNQAMVSQSDSTVPVAAVLESLSTLPRGWDGNATALPTQRWYTLQFDDGGWSLPAIYVERACTNCKRPANPS